MNKESQGNFPHCSLLLKQNYLNDFQDFGKFLDQQIFLEILLKERLLGSKLVHGIHSACSFSIYLMHFAILFLKFRVFLRVFLNFRAIFERFVYFFNLI